jgi:hypothetical protein
MSPFAGYLLGLLVLIGGLAVAAYLLNVPTTAIIVAVALGVLAMFAWATRRSRARPSSFTGTTPNSPSLDRTVLMELKTTLMQRPDTGRNEPTTRMPQADDSRSQPTTRVDRHTDVAKGQKPSPQDD